MRSVAEVWGYYITLDRAVGAGTDRDRREIVPAEAAKASNLVTCAKTKTGLKQRYLKLPYQSWSNIYIHQYLENV